MSGSTSNSHIEPFIDVVDDLFLFQHVDQPKRFRQNVLPSLLDLIFTSELDMINNLSYLPPLGNSDHICIKFNLVCYAEEKKSKYNLKVANYDLIKETLSNVDWISLLSPLDTDDAWSLFKSIFQNIIDDCIPTYIPREKKNIYTNSEVFTLKKRKTNYGRSTFQLTLLVTYQILSQQIIN